MMTFANDRTIPPGSRFFYEVPETKVVLSFLTRSELFHSIRKHYGENNLAAPEDLEKRVIDFMCCRLPKGFCIGAPETGPLHHAITMSQVKQHTVDLASSTGRVTPGEAKRRALICGACPLNDRSGCPTCSGLNAWASKIGGVPVPGGATYLGICSVDGLAMSAGVALESAPVARKPPENCWRKAKNDN